MTANQNTSENLAITGLQTTTRYGQPSTATRERKERMNSYVQQIYNGAAMLAEDTSVPLDLLDKHMLRTSLFRIEVELGRKKRPEPEHEAAIAYMRGYEDESE